jgi:hypothetical protein
VDAEDDVLCGEFGDGEVNVDDFGRQGADESVPVIEGAAVLAIVAWGSAGTDKKVWGGRTFKPWTFVVGLEFFEE